MAKQYWVGEFYVDLSRNQISQLGQSQTLPPKALKVLTQLAENRGKVVTYDELLDNVWPDSVVTPNTLQRCIAQLRKALGEDSKVAGIIKTHAKQGYSLECDVNWSENVQSEIAGTEHQKEQQVVEEPNIQACATDSQESADKSQPQSKLRTKDLENNKSKVFWIGTTVLVLLLLTVFVPFLKDTNTLKFNDLRYLTATDDKEYGSSYSPDGQFILFHRYLDKVCVNNIWAKNTDTLEEILLTKEMGTYGAHSFSKDGNTLVFIKQQDCRKPITQNTCYSLMKLDFKQALTQSQTPQELLNCRNSAIKRPVWTDEQHIVMMQKDDLRWRLIRYSVTDDSSTNLYQVEDGNILFFTYSASHNMLAVISLKNDGKQYIEMLNPEGVVMSSYPVGLPQGLPQLFKIMPEFIPHSEQLIFGAGGKLFSMSIYGEVHQVDFPFADKLGSPKFHPDGSRMLMGKGRYDSDIAKISIQPQLANQERQYNQSDMSVIERSIEGEESAKYQPNGKHIAFTSRRTGTDQVWLFDGARSTVLSNFPSGNYIRDIHWSSDGSRLLVLTDQKLQLMLLSKELSPIEFSYPVVDLFHWDAETQRVVAKIILNGIGKLVEIDLVTLEHRLLTNQKVKWAAHSQRGDLIFMDHLARFWRKTNGAVEATLIEPLVEQGSSKRFIVNNELLHGINRENQLWSYNLQSADFNILTTVTKDIDYLTDVSNNEFLVTFVVAEKKEVVELVVKQ